jgi:ornithine cyclodeaminase
LEDGTITKEDFTGDIGDVLLGNLVGRENDEEIIVFKTVGIGAQDLVTAQKIYEKAREAAVGTEWD